MEKTEARIKLKDTYREGFAGGKKGGEKWPLRGINFRYVGRPILQGEEGGAFRKKRETDVGCIGWGS